MRQYWIWVLLCCLLCYAHELSYTIFFLNQCLQEFKALLEFKKKKKLCLFSCFPSHQPLLSFQIPATADLPCVCFSHFQSPFPFSLLASLHIKHIHWGPSLQSSARSPNVLCSLSAPATAATVSCSTFLPLAGFVFPFWLITWCQTLPWTSHQVNDGLLPLSLAFESTSVCKTVTYPTQFQLIDTEYKSNTGAPNNRHTGTYAHKNTLLLCHYKCSQSLLKTLRKSGLAAILTLKCKESLNDQRHRQSR